MFFDYQVNGFAGVDFQRDDLTAAELLTAVQGLARHQTSAILLTLITDAIDSICRKLENIERIRRSDDRIDSVIRGYHIEGPWISSEAGYYGAHPVSKVVAPSLTDYTKLRDAGAGNIRLITLAPEVPGAIEVIEAAANDNVRISIGHSNASEADIDAAISAGATLATHVGNAVPLEMHRHDNVIQRLLSRDDLIACFIPDGLHLPPFVLQNYFRAKPAGRAFFTTDCMAAAGAPPGRYTVGPHTVEVGDDGIVYLPGEKRFAGSSLTMDRAFTNIRTWLGIGEREARALCSTIPASHFGIDL
ncbi:MAG: hypothetical protein R2832_16720 [Rhodothermales bacterium]